MNILLTVETSSKNCTIIETLKKKGPGGREPHLGTFILHLTQLAGLAPEAEHSAVLPIYSFPFYRDVRGENFNQAFCVRVFARSPFFIRHKGAFLSAADNFPQLSQT